MTGGGRELGGGSLERVFSILGPARPKSGLCHVGGPVVVVCMKKFE